MKIKSKLLDDVPAFSKAIPTIGSAGAGAYDLRLARFEDEEFPKEVDSDGYRKHLPSRRFMLEAGAVTKVGFGFALEVPKGYVALIIARSGLGCSGLKPNNCIGLIDSDYRGEVMSCITNSNSRPVLLERDMRIAQMFVVRAEELSFDFVNELSPTQRGDGGFNSTGSK